MKETRELKLAIKLLSFVFMFIILLIPIKGLFAYMDDDLSYLGLIMLDSNPTILWIQFVTKFISYIMFFVGLRFLIKTLNFEDTASLFNTEKVTLFRKTGFYFLLSAAVGSLQLVASLFDGKFANLKDGTDAIFIQYFSLIIGFFFFIFSKILETAKELKQENDLTI